MNSAGTEKTRLKRGKAKKDRSSQVQLATFSRGQQFFVILPSDSEKVVDLSIETEGKWEGNFSWPTKEAPVLLLIECRTRFRFKVDRLSLRSRKLLLC